MNKKLTQDIFKGKDKKWQWAAIDGVNSIPTLFTHKPEKSKLFIFYMNAEGEYQDLHEDTGYSAKNWEDSLIEREVINKITKRGLQKDIELLESGIAMNWSDMKKIETRLNREMSGMQIKINEFQLQLEGQQRQIHLAAEVIGSNKQAIVRIEDKDKIQIKATTKSVWGSDGTKWGISEGDFENHLIERKAKLKTLDQSVFKGLDKKWRFAAVDSYGDGYIFEPKPRAEDDGYIVVGAKWKKIGGGYNAKNWMDSLIEREAEVELTGSDLCKALKKERDWVLAYVSNENDATAEFHQRAVIVTGIADKGDFICSGGRWRYAVPVSHNGKILSAKDVGII